MQVTNVVPTVTTQKALVRELSGKRSKPYQVYIRIKTADGKTTVQGLGNYPSKPEAYVRAHEYNEAIKEAEGLPAHKENSYIARRGDRMQAFPNKLWLKEADSFLLSLSPEQATALPPLFQLVGHWFGTRASGVVSQTQTQPSVDCPTFAKLYELWLQSAGAQKLSEGRVKSLMAAYNHCKKIHDSIYSNLRHDDFDKVIQACPSETLKKVIKNLLEKLDKHAKGNGYITVGYSEFVEVNVNEENIKKQDKKPFTNEEIATIWKNVNTVKNADLVLMLLYTGCRIGEFANIRKADVNFNEGYFTVTQSKTASGKGRKIPIHSAVLPLFEARLRDVTDRLFEIDTQGVARRFDGVMEKLGMSYTPHEARHTFVTELRRKDAKKVWQDRIVGHKSGNVGDDTYTHVTIDELKETVELITYNVALAA